MKMFSSITKALIHSLNNNGELVDLFNPSEEDRHFLTILANNEEECDEKAVLGALELTFEVTLAGTMTFNGDIVSGKKWKIRYFLTSSRVGFGRKSITFDKEVEYDQGNCFSG